MPTGYTADVQSGKIVTFSDFAMQCARAFGACIDMRDDPADKPIPEQFEPHLSYRDKELAKAEARLVELRRMSSAEIVAASGEAHNAACASWHDRATKRTTTRARYETMLAHVNAWSPPTDDHREMQTFMADQLRQSIEFDCSTCHNDKPTKLAPEDWHAKEIADATWSANYHGRSRAEEIERTAKRNKWIADLRASLFPGVSQ